MSKKWKSLKTLHHPCSRVELTSTLLTLEFKGSHRAYITCKMKTRRHIKQLRYLTTFMTLEKRFNKWMFLE